MSNLIKKIQNTTHQNDLWKRKAKIVLGVSGGPDSVCLLDVLSKLVLKYDLQLIIAHVNYGLRGADSERDEEFVRTLAKEYKLPFFKLSPALSLPKERGVKKIHSENELRLIRYDFFERVRAKNNFDAIAVAHNADDQVETFLMRVLRGAGLKGLSAMQYKTGKIIRPFLGITRAEILEYLKKEKINYRTDKTNKASLFFRNKIRNKLIPYLEKNFNPQIKKTIFEAVGSIAEDHALIQKLSARAHKADQPLSVKKILKLHPALQRRVLFEMISQKKSDKKDIEASHIAEILKALKSTKGKNQIVTFKGLKVVRKGDRVTLDNF